jgi:hypothetical protein
MIYDLDLVFRDGEVGDWEYRDQCVSIQIGCVVYVGLCEGVQVVSGRRYLCLAILNDLHISCSNFV